MFMKKNVLVSLSVATLLSVGAVGVNEIIQMLYKQQ